MTVQEQPLILEGNFDAQGLEPLFVEELELEREPSAVDFKEAQKSVAQQLDSLAEQEESKARLQRQVLALVAKATMRRVSRRRVTCARMRCRRQARECDFMRQARRGRFSQKDPVIRRLRRCVRQQRKQARKARQTMQGRPDAGPSGREEESCLAVASLPEECGQFLCSCCGESIAGVPVCFADEGALFQEPYHFGCLCDKGSWRPWCRVVPLHNFDSEPQSKVVYSTREFDGNKKLQRRRAFAAGARAALAGGAAKKWQQPEQESDSKKHVEREEALQAFEDLARKLGHSPLEWNGKKKTRKRKPKHTRLRNEKQ